MKTYTIIFVVIYMVQLQSVTAKFLGVSERSEDQQCRCVPYDQCQTNSAANELTNIEQNTCDNKLEVCCNLDDQISATDKVSTFAYDSKGKQCGYRFGERPTRFWQYAYAIEFPWMVRIVSVKNIRENETEEVYECGGTLIHPQSVLTAAHCVSNLKKKYAVRVGELNIQMSYPSQYRMVKNIELYDKFENRSNDLAILFLETPVSLSGYADIICLPQEDTVIPVGTTCWATGWGKLGLNDKYAYRLQKVDLPIVDRDNCQSKLRTTRLGKDFILDNNLFCAGGENKGTCEGDDGGPIFCPIKGEDGRYELTGVIGEDVTCGKVDIPAPYLNVAAFRTWIDKHMKLQNLDGST